MTVTGAPRLVVTVGAATKYATYQSGSTSSALVFRYSVGGGENDSDGVAINTTIDLNSGTIKDAANNSATLTMSLGSTSGIIVDTTAPSVSSITAVSDGSYKSGDAMSTSVVFDEAVTVTGTPRISMDVGGSTVYATYASGSTTTTLVFSYSVSGGDTDSDGIALSSPIDLNSGTIKDVAGNASALTFSVPNTSAVLVDTTAPATSSATLVADGDYVTSSSVSVTVNFNSTVIVTGTPYISIDVGGSSKQASYASGSNSTALVFTYSVAGGDNDQDGIAVSSPIALNSGTIKDVAGNDSALTFSAPSGTGVTVNYTNSTPVVSGTCSTSGTQDVAYSCTPGVTDADGGDTQTWSLNGTNDCAWAAINPSTGAISGTPTDAQVGTCTLAFKTNDATIDSNILSFSVAVANVAPTLTISNASNILKAASSSVIRADGDVAASEEGQGVYSLNNAAASSPKCSDNTLGLSIDSSTGAVTFQPAASYSGTCYIKVQFDDQNASSNTVNAEFTIEVISLDISPATVSVAALDQETFTASNGSTPYSYSIVSGGGSINSSTGVYTAGGSAESVVVRATDNNGATADAAVTVTAPVPVHTYLNSSDKHASITVSPDNLSASTATGSWQAIRAAHGHSTGKWYWEITLTNKGYSMFGIAEASTSLSAQLGSDAASYGYYTYNGQKYNSGAQAYTTTPNTGDVVGIALDLDNGTLEFYVNGESRGEAFTSISGTYYPALGLHSSSDLTVNFGQQDFVYTTPTGFYPGFAVDANAIIPVGAFDPNGGSPSAAISGYYQFSPLGGTTPYSYSVVSGTGSIDSNGLYSAPSSEGTATIRVTDNDGDYSDAEISVISGAALNPSDKDASITLSNNNFTAVSGTSGWRAVRADKGVSSGKWYWEVTSESGGANHMQVGILNASGTLGSYLGSTVDGYGYSSHPSYYHNGSGASASGSPTTFTIDDIIGVALDMDNGTLGFYKNGTSFGTAWTGISGTYYPAIAFNGLANKGSVNFGATAFTHSTPPGFLPFGPVAFNLSLSDATENIAKNATYTFEGIGGKPPHTYSLISGDGSIDSSTGVYTAPSNTTTATVRVTDANSNTADASVAVVDVIFTTLNQSDKSATVLLSNSNTTAITGTASWQTVRASHGQSSGKWYWEVTVTRRGYSMVGIAKSSVALGAQLGSDANGYGLYAYNGTKYNSGDAAYTSALSDGDVLGVALDLDNGTLEFYINGVSQGEAFNSISGTFYPALSLHTGSDMTANFGSSAFLYTVPTGFTAGFTD